MPCEDCGSLFPLQQSSGSCLKCVKLQPHLHDSIEYSDILVRHWPFARHGEKPNNLSRNGPSAKYVVSQGGTCQPPVSSKLVGLRTAINKQTLHPLVSHFLGVKKIERILVLLCHKVPQASTVTQLQNLAQNVPDSGSSNTRST